MTLTRAQQKADLWEGQEPQGSAFVGLSILVAFYQPPVILSSPLHIELSRLGQMLAVSQVGVDPFRVTGWER